MVPVLRIGSKEELPLRKLSISVRKCGRLTVETPADVPPADRARSNAPVMSHVSIAEDDL